MEKLSAAKDKLADRAMIAGGAMLYLGGKCVVAAADAAEVQSKFDAVFKGNAASVRQWANEQADSIGRSKYEMEAYLSTMQDTFVPMGVARDEAAELSKRVTTLALDIASFNHAADPEVLRNIQSALVGNHEAVRGYSVMITEATLNAELMRMGIDGGTRAASEQQKMMARLNLIIAGTSDAQGDATRTAGSAANQFKAFKSKTSELAVTVGESLLPVVQAVTPVITDMVTVLGKFAESPVGQVAIQVGMGFAAFAGGLGLANKAIGAFRDTVGIIRSAIFWYQAKVGANTALIKAETTALRENTAAQIANGIAAEGAGTKRGTGTAIDAAGDFIGGKGGKAGKVAKGGWWKSVAKYAGNLWKKGSGWIMSGITLLAQYGSQIGGWATQAAGTVGQAASSAGSAISSAASSAGSSIMATANAAGSAMSGGIGMGTLLTTDVGGIAAAGGTAAVGTAALGVTVAAGGGYAAGTQIRKPMYRAGWLGPAAQEAQLIADESNARKRSVGDYQSKLQKMTPAERRAYIGSGEWRGGGAQKLEVTHRHTASNKFAAELARSPEVQQSTERVVRNDKRPKKW